MINIVLFGKPGEKELQAEFLKENTFNTLSTEIF
jgi:hypothetical protein